MRRVRHVRSRADRPPEARDRGSETRVAAWSGRHSTYRSVAFDRLRDNRALPNEAGRIQARNQTDARPLRKPRPADIPTLRIVQLMEYAVLPPPAGPGRLGQSKRKAGIEDAGSDQLRTQIHDRFRVGDRDQPRPC